MSEELHIWFYIADLAGVAVFAISGALAAGRKSLDWLGVFVIAVVTAIGGGTTRDILLDRTPVFWINDPTYLYVILASALLTILLFRYKKPPLRFLLIADAFGLALFALLGAGIAKSMDANWLIIIIMGTITGVAGGVIRDIITNEIPLILRRDFYATAAISGILVFLILLQAGLTETASIFIGMAVVVVLRFAAIFKGLRLPVFQLPEEPH